MVVSTVWSYEPVRRAWYSESGLAVPRKDFGLVVHRMALYAIGGQDKKGRLICIYLIMLTFSYRYLKTSSIYLLYFQWLVANEST